MKNGAFGSLCGLAITALVVSCAAGPVSAQTAPAADNWTPRSRPKADDVSAGQPVSIVGRPCSCALGLLLPRVPTANRSSGTYVQILGSIQVFE